MLLPQGAPVRNLIDHELDLTVLRLCRCWGEPWPAEPSDHDEQVWFRPAEAAALRR